MTKDPREVGPLSRGVISPDDSTPIRSGYRSGIRFLPHPLPAVPSATSLRRAYPEEEDDGLTTFHG